jgi:hypothetical protein
MGIEHVRSEIEHMRIQVGRQRKETRNDDSVISGSAARSFRHGSPLDEIRHRTSLRRPGKGRAPDPRDRQRGGGDPGRPHSRREDQRPVFVFATAAARRSAAPAWRTRSSVAGAELFDRRAALADQFKNYWPPGTSGNGTGLKETSGGTRL